MKTMQSVLIADESNVTQHILATTYIKAGYLIRTASSVDELKTALRIDSISLLLLSIGFSRGNPFELIRYIKKEKPQTKIVLMATSLSISETVEFMKAGVSDCVVKPFQAEKLLKKTEQMFETTDKANDVYFDNSNGVRTPKVTAYNLQLDSDPDEEPNLLIREIEVTVSSIKNYRVNVLITGETGTGKTLYAKKIHYGEATRREPFVSFNCEAILPEEMERLLFGEVTKDGGSAKPVTGRLKQAGKGTLYLQGLDQMPLELQSKMVNVLQERSFEPLGAESSQPFEARIIATMTISPEQGIATEKIRKDLYYLLNEVRLDLPPLRLCKDRIPKLVYTMMQNLSRETGIGIPRVTENYWNILSAHDWPGNVRELANVVKYSFLIAQGKEMTSGMLPLSVSQSYSKRMPSASNDDYFDLRDYLKEQEKEIIFQTLEKFNGNKIQTAQYLRISERSLRYKINEFNNE